MDKENVIKKIKEILQWNGPSKLERFIYENNFTSINLSNFNEILIYAIKINASIEVIQFILNKQYNKSLNLNFFNNKNETPLLLAISENNFEIANLLIKNKADINYMAKNYEIVDVLFKENQLNTRNLKFILNNGLNEKNITLNLIEKLIVLKKNEFLEIIFVHYNKYNIFFVNSFLNFYKNKTTLSDKELLRLMPKERNKLEVKEEMYKTAYSSKNWKVFRILFENDKSNDTVYLNRILKYDLLECAIKSNNYNFVKKVLRYIMNLTKPLDLTDHHTTSLMTQNNNNNNNNDNNYNNITPKLCHTIFCHGINKITNKEIYPFLEAVKQNNIEIVELLIEFANTYGIIININDRDEWWGNYPLLEAIKQNNVIMVKLLVDYDRKIWTKEIKRKIELKNSPLLEGIKHNNIDIVKLLFDYANYHNIIININESNALGQYPLLKVIQYNNLSMIKLLLDYADTHSISIDLDDLFLTAVKQNNVETVNTLMDYANNHNIDVNINNKDEWENSSLLNAIDRDNIEMVKLILNYSKNHEIPLKLNDNNNNGHYSLMEAIYKNNIDVIELLVNYSNDQNIMLDLNKKTAHKNYPLMQAFKQNNRRIIDVLMNYAEFHNVVLNINDQCYDENMECKNYPLLEAIKQNNIDLIKLLIDYADKHQIMVNLNEKTELKSSPLLEAIDCNNMNIIKLLLDYAYIHKINLEINKYQWGHLLNPFFRAKINGNIAIIKLLKNYATDSNIFGINIDDENIINL